MKRLLLVMMLGCSSDPIAHGYPTGTYTIFLDPLSGTCGSLPTTTIDLKYVQFLDVDGADMAITCSYQFGSCRTRLYGRVHYFGQGSTELIGRLDAQVLNSDGSTRCSGVYDTLWVKQ
jgi:hypothetical protein